MAIRLRKTFRGIMRAQIVRCEKLMEQLKIRDRARSPAMSLWIDPADIAARDRVIARLHASQAQETPF